MTSKHTPAKSPETESDAGEPVPGSEELFRGAFENAAVGASVVDLKGRYIRVNKRLCEMLGYTEQELLARTFSDVTHPDDVQKGFDAMRALVSGEVSQVTLEKRYVHKDGSFVHAIVSPSVIRDRSGKVLFCLGLWQDITEQKRTEGVLKETNTRLQALIQAIPDMIVFKDVAGRHVIVNKAVEQVTGHSRSEIIGRTVEELLPPGAAAACRKSDEEAMKRREPLHVEERVPQSDGTIMLFDMAKAAMIGPAGEVLGLVVVGRDMTERMLIEEELRKHRTHLMSLVEERTQELKKTNEQLLKEVTERERMEAELINAQKLESLGILAGGIAHDFNNLLTSVFSNISMALLDLDQTHPARAQLNLAERAMLRAQDLTRQLLIFSKGGEPVKQTVALGELVSEAAGFAMRGSRVRSEVSIAPDLWLANVDPGQISQVVHNLMINADHAMPEGGTIRVRCENTEIEAGAAPLVTPGKYVKITVQDSGIGIQKEHLPKIFDPYFTTKQRGSGLGLATAYSIIRKHGGHISVQSEPGVRTVFTVLLPAAPGPSRHTAESRAALRKGSGRILVMDDEEDVRQATGNALKRMGYSVEKAEDGARAVEMYEEAKKVGKPFDAVIMDLTIPGGMGGKDAIKQLIKIDPKVKAIVSSGYSNDPVMADYVAYGFVGVVSKPYRLIELSETVYRVVTQASG